LPGLQFVIDPTEAELALSKTNGYDVLAPVKSKPAPTEQLLASNIDSEGELSAGRKTGNSEHTLGIRLTGESEEEFRRRQSELEQKMYKLDAEGGTLRVIYPDGSWIDWEIRGVQVGEKLLDNRFVQHQRTEDEVTFTCAPFGEEEEELLDEFEGEALRVLECVIDEVGGSAPALARAEIVSPDADVWDLKWGRDSRRYSDAETAKAYYPATDLTPLGGARSTTATVEGESETPVVEQATLTPNWTAVLSTDLFGLGSMTHEGVYEVFAWVCMPTSNAGEVGILFEYGVGAGPRIELEELTFEADHPLEGKIVQLSLGQVFLRAPELGAHFWEGRVVSRSSVAGDSLQILDFALRPLEEGRGEVSVSPRLAQPSSLLIRDEFSQSAGDLNGKQLAAIGSQSGPLVASAAVDSPGVGETPWEVAKNAQAIDGSAAWAVVHALGPGTHFLKLTDFGFSLPDTATIEGIKFEVAKAKSGLNNTGAPQNSNSSVADLALRAVKGGVIQGSDFSSAAWWYSAFPNAEKGPFPFTSYGGPDELFGTAWLYSDLNDSEFGVAIAAQVVIGGIQERAYVDGARATVYWSDSGGNKWVTSGDATDISVEESAHTAQRKAVSDANIESGRYAIAGSTLVTDVVAGIKAKRAAMSAAANERVRGGSLVRYIDDENWLFCGADAEAAALPVTDTVCVVKRVAGTVTELGRATISDSTDYRQFWLHVDRRGRYFCWGLLLEGGAPRLLLVGQDNDLIEGGALDEGKTGFYDAKTGPNPNTRVYDQFVAWIPPLEAVIFKGLSLQLRPSRVERESPGGGSYTPISSSGDYLRLSPSGLEERKNRLVFIASANDPATMGVGFPTDLKVVVYAKRRHRTIPDPA
jgi:hypothetical protein